jgi:hypothetical protein
LCSALSVEVAFTNARMCRCDSTQWATVCFLSLLFRVVTTAFAPCPPESGESCIHGQPKFFPMKNEVASWIEIQRKVNEPAPLNKDWSNEEKESSLYYLHGFIVGNEVKACCYYEYARASETLRKARREYDPVNPEDSSLKISRYSPHWIIEAQRWCFVQCINFPNSPWRDLGREERENFRLLLKPISPWPIITDLRALNAIGVFDRFKRVARRKPLGRICPAMLGGDAIKHVVITVDYRDGVDAVKEQFTRWLKSESNRKRFKKYYKKPIHKQNPESPGRYKELLKFLAAWRLYHELGFEAAKEWTQKNRRQKDYHPQPFFREKLRKMPSGMHYRGPVFKDERQWEAATVKAKCFLVGEIEYGQFRRGRGMT